MQTIPPKCIPKSLVASIGLYLVASLVHFVHNAEFLRDYPNLPASWTSTGIYVAWLGMTSVGLSGYVLMSRGHPRLGLGALMIYCALGSLRRRHFW